MWLLIGLGNPGAKYDNNRHNIGVMAVDAIAHRHNFSSPRQRFKSDTTEGKFGTEKILILKPHTYMNLSGEAVQEAAHFYKIPLDHIIVFHDDLDLPPTKVRVKQGGGAGGHNGLKSIDQHMGKDYTRVRIGIGHPGDKNRVHSYVLGDFAKADQKWLEKLLETIANEAPYLVEGKNDKFMSNIAMQCAPQKKETKAE